MQVKYFYIFRDTTCQLTIFVVHRTGNILFLSMFHFSKQYCSLSVVGLFKDSAIFIFTCSTDLKRIPFNAIFIFGNTLKSEGAYLVNSKDTQAQDCTYFL